MYFTQKYQESIFKDLNTIKYKISKSHFHFGLEYHYFFLCTHVILYSVMQYHILRHKNKNGILFILFSSDYFCKGVECVANSTMVEIINKVSFFSQCYFHSPLYTLAVFLQDFFLTPQLNYSPCLHLSTQNI